MKKTKTLSFLALLITIICAFAAFTFVGCKPSKTSGVTITLSQTEVNVNEGKTATVVATVKGSDEEIVWTVEDDTVATVKAVKKVATVSGKKVGTTTLTAAIGETKATCKINVKADNTEKVTITLDGEAVTTASVDMGESITLAATASNGSAITWETSNSNVATVANGVVTGVKPGTATITAKVTASIKAEVEVTVNSVGGYEYYEIELNGGAADANSHPGTWAYWTEWGQFTALNYDNGTVNLEFTENGGNWYNIQLFNVNPLIQAAKYYKLTCDIQTTVAGHVTINGNVVNLQTGKHTYEVYFTNGNGFSMQFGVEGSGLDIPAATVAISNISYEEDTERVTLETPSFTYNADTGVITINDDNAAGVKNYVLNLYQNDTKMTGVTVAHSGEKVDLSKVTNGTYQAKLQAVATNVHYIDSGESAAVEIEVENEGGISYSFSTSDDPSSKDGNGVNAIAQAGIWTFWSESWVTVDGNFTDNKLTVEFSNNSGNWYDTQLFYRHPGLESGKVYDLVLSINSTAGGRVTLNGSEFTIQSGTHDYDVVFTENGGLSVQFTFGLNGQNNAQEIQAATMIFEIKSVEEANQTQLVAPSFTVASNVITITDTNAAGVGKYELGFFQNDDLKITVDVTNGGEIDLSKVGAGAYTVKLRAVAENMLYLTSDWSTDSETITSSNTDVPIGYNAEGTLTSGWSYWNADWEGIAVDEDGCYLDTITNTVHFTYTGSGSWYGAQLFYKANDGAETWNVEVSIKATNAGKYTVCGQVVELAANEAQTVTVSGYKSASGGSTIAIQCGADGVGMVAGENTVELTVVSITAA